MPIGVAHEGKMVGGAVQAVGLTALVKGQLLIFGTI